LTLSDPYTPHGEKPLLDGVVIRIEAAGICIRILREPLAEYVYISPDTYARKTPETMPSDIAALLDPLAIAVRSIGMVQSECGTLTRF
jgi:threonine dehydrogenase-like Zn-dependent dehydrogenase